MGGPWPPVSAIYAPVTKKRSMRHTSSRKSCQLPVFCLPHQDEGIPLSAFSKAQQVNLPACSSHCPCNAERQAGKLQISILKSLVWPCSESNPSLQRIPHHATREKFLVVFDCAPSYQGVSLNNKLLQGQGLTNNLVGVLLRCCNDPAIMPNRKGFYLKH